MASPIITTGRKEKKTVTYNLTDRGIKKQREQDKGEISTLVVREMECAY